MITRRAVAVMVSRFPLVTETFILRELIELERQGQPVLLVPMLKEMPRVVHAEARPWVERALYTPYLSAAIALANARLLLRRPARYLGILARLIFGSLKSLDFLIRTIAIFPKSVYLAEELEKQGIRHVHAHFATHPATMAVIISALTDIGFSITAHAHDIFVNRTLLGMKLRRARFVRTISKFNRDFLAARYSGFASKIAVIHIGINLENYATRERGPGTRNLLLCIAAFKPYKGIPVLIEACEKLVSRGMEFCCQIIGDGPLRPRIEELIRGKGLADRVQLLGNRTQSEVAERIQDAAIVVIPSVVAPDGQMDGIPVALMEAMAAERPVVASALSGIPELVEHGKTGLLVAPGDATALAEAISRVLKDPTAAVQMGQAGRERVRAEFTLSAAVARLLQTLDALNEQPEITIDELRLLSEFVSAPIGVRRVHERADSRVVEIIAGGRELILKTQKSRAGQSGLPVERARHEFEILERLAGCGLAPRALRLDSATIVMERARGIALDTLIRELRSTPQQLVPAFRAVGEWLRRFQSVFPTFRHGDMWPGNIFISGEGVEVIDFEGLRRGSTDQDVENFLSHTRKFFARPHLRRHFAMLRNAFAEGYRA